MSHPLHPTFKTEWLPLVMTAITAAAAFYFYAHFPEQVATHWNFAGEADDFSGKAGAAFGLASIVPGMYLLMMAFPYLDPKKDRYAEFRGVYLGFRTLMMAVMLAIYLASGFWNLGYNVRINYVVPFVIGVMFLFLGNYMGKIKPNWFFGIRTPWTMSSESVWNRTHRVGGWMFVLFGLALMATPMLPEALGMGVFLGCAILAVLGTIVYSYVVYRQEQKQKPPEPPQGL